MSFSINRYKVQRTIYQNIGIFSINGDYFARFCMYNFAVINMDLGLLNLSSTNLTQVNKKGNSNSSIVKKCQTINKELNKCVVDISPQYNDILESIKSAVKHIELFIESDMQSNSELKEARDYLNNAIQKIKQEDMRFEDKTVSVISHSE